MQRQTKLALSIVALAVATAALGFALARRAASRRLVDLGTCLIGDPLAENEKASDRMLRIELARPRQVDPKAVAWPETCAEIADLAAHSWGLPGGERERLAKLADDLANKELEPAQKGRSADDIAWLRERRAFEGSIAERPWRPVTMSAREPAPPLPCHPWSTRATAERAIFGGKADCAVVSTPDARLSVLRVARPEDALPPTPTSPDAKTVGGEGTTVTSCKTANGTAVVATTSDRRKRLHSVVTAFLDHNGAMSELGTSTVTSQFDDGAHNPLRSLDSSKAIASCGPNELRVTWAWATLIGGKPHEELVVMTCVPGRCETKTKVVHIETGRHSNCGYCRPSEDQFQLEPPTVIDLFGATALIWNYDQALRVRIAPLDQLDALVDHVVWYEPDQRKWYFGQPIVLTSHDVAIVGFLSPYDPPDTRFFRLAASGARELTISK